MLFLAILAMLFLADCIALADGHEAWNWIGGIVVLLVMWATLLVLRVRGWL